MEGSGQRAITFGLKKQVPFSLFDGLDFVDDSVSLEDEVFGSGPCPLQLQELLPPKFLLLIHRNGIRG